MKVIYDPQTDSLTIILKGCSVKESDEIRGGLIVDYGGDDRIVAIEMLSTHPKMQQSSLALLYEVKGQMTPVAAWKRLRYASAITSHTENKEKKLLDGFLAGRERLIEEVRKEDVQMRLFE